MVVTAPAPEPWRHRSTDPEAGIYPDRHAPGHVQVDRVAHRLIVVALWVVAAAALCTCALHRARWIETDLLLRAQAALIDARIPYHRLTFQGVTRSSDRPSSQGPPGIASPRWWPLFPVYGVS